jgi:glyoxylase-like metal-dependent hydrolase (beta-lactamase superfamily II)
MTRKCLAVLALAGMFVGVASAQDAKTVIADATKAMGYTGLNTIVYSGPLSREGAATLGQWMSPTKGWHGNTVKNFTRFIDYGAGTSQRTGLQSRPGDPATGLLPGGAGLDPNAAENPNTANVPATGAWAARLDVTLSPPAFLKLAAAAPNATAKKQSMNGKKYVVVSFDSDQKAPSGVAYKLTGYINSQTNMLEKVETAYEDTSAANGYLLGDVLVEQTYSDFKDFNGVKFPTQISQSRAGVLFSEATITDVKPNAPAPAAPAAAAGGGGGRGAGAPGAAAGGGRGADGGGRGGAAAGGGRGADGGARGGAAAGAPAGGAPAAGGGRGGGGGGGGAAAAAGPRKLAEGVFVLISGGARAMAVEMKDGIVVIDAPPNGVDLLVAQAKEAIPNKPITHFITSHMHFDHVAGMRTVLADGPKPVTLITNEMNKPIIEKWLSNPHSLQANVAATTAVPPVPGAAAPAAGGGRGGAAAAPAPWPDALARSGKKVKFQYVKDKLVLKDSVNTIEIYPIKGVLHAEDMMVIYVPKAKAIYQADAYNPAAQPGAVTNPTTNGGQLAFQKLLASELDRLKIDYETIVAGHTREASKQDLMVAIGRVPPPAPVTPPAGAPPAGGGQRGQ